MSATSVVVISPADLETLIRKVVASELEAETSRRHESDILDCAAAAVLLRMRPKVIERKARDGEIPAHKPPGMRGWRFSKADLVAWVSSRAED